MTFAEKLKLLLMHRTAREVAAQARIGPSAITNYLRRGSVPSANVALRLAKALDVDLMWLLDDSASWPAPAKPAARVA